MRKRDIAAESSDLYRKFKGVAAIRGIKINEAFREAMGKWIEENEQCNCNMISDRMFDRDCKTFLHAVKSSKKYGRNATRTYMETRRIDINGWTDDYFGKIAKTLINRGEIGIETGRGGCIYYSLNEGGGQK